MKLKKVIYIIMLVTIMSVIFGACVSDKEEKEVPSEYVYEFDAGSAFDINAKGVVRYDKVGDGELKVLQLTDIHYDDHNANPIRRKQVIDMLSNLILEQSPDIVAVTGDWTSNSFNLLDGEKEKYLSLYNIDLSESNKSNNGSIIGLREGRSRELFDAIDSACKQVGAKWTAVFGNHDAEGDMSKYDYADLFKEYEQCLFDSGFSNIKGVGNYVVAVYRDNKLAQALFMIDSHQSIFYGSSQYDYIGKNQIEWYKWCVNGLNQEYNKNYQGVIPSMAYLHIPLNEYKKAFKKAQGTQDYIIGGQKEGVYAPYKNTGLFNAMIDGKSTKAVFAGHDHDNNMAANYKGIVLAYGVQSGWCDEYATTSPKGALIAYFNQDSTVTINHIYKFNQDLVF